MKFQGWQQIAVPVFHSSPMPAAQKFFRFLAPLVFGGFLIAPVCPGQSPSPQSAPASKPEAGKPASSAPAAPAAAKEKAPAAPAKAQSSKPAEQPKKDAPKQAGQADKEKPAKKKEKNAEKGQAGPAAAAKKDASPAPKPAAPESKAPSPAEKTAKAPKPETKPSAPAPVVKAAAAPATKPTAPKAESAPAPAPQKPATPPPASKPAEPVAAAKPQPEPPKQPKAEVSHKPAPEKKEMAETAAKKAEVEPDRPARSHSPRKGSSSSAAAASVRASSESKEEPEVKKTPSLRFPFPFGSKKKSALSSVRGQASRKTPSAAPELSGVPDAIARQARDSFARGAAFFIYSDRNEVWRGQGTVKGRIHYIKNPESRRGLVRAFAYTEGTDLHKERKRFGAFCAPDSAISSQGEIEVDYNGLRRNSSTVTQLSGKSLLHVVLYPGTMSSRTVTRGMPEGIISNELVIPIEF